MTTRLVSTSSSAPRCARSANDRRRFRHRPVSDIPAPVRQAVLDRDDNQCVVCGGTWRLELHHVIYRSHGGMHEEGNLATLCQRCHGLIHAKLITIAYLQSSTGEYCWFTTYAKSSTE